MSITDHILISVKRKINDQKLKKIKINNVVYVLSKTWNDL